MRAALLVAVAVLVAAACANGAEPATPGQPSATVVATTSVPADPTATAAPPTTRLSPTTTATTRSPTTTAPPPEPWHVPGRDYYFPVQPPGAADYGPDHHDYPATDIFAAEGTTLVAVTAGVVDEVGRIDEWDPAVDDPATRSGLYVSIVGDDGIRYYYSHLLSIVPRLSAGDRVRAGQVIGRLGRTGNAAPTPPHVHFGISPPTFPGDWEVRRGVVAPYEYLQAWTAGTDRAPELP